MAGKFDEMMNNPERHFARPDNIVASRDLTREQKIKLLQQWQNDLTLRHEAETEGMERSEKERAQVLPAITNALVELGVDSAIK